MTYNLGVTRNDGIVWFCAAALALLFLPQGLAQNATVAGKWHLVAQTEGGDRTAEPVFQQDGEKVTGKWGDADVRGTFSGGKLDLAFPYTSDEAGSGILKIKGELKGDTLTGSWEFQEYHGSFTATRSSTPQ